MAADGLRSRIRASWPRDPGTRYAGYTAWRGVTEGRVDLDGGAGETWGRGRRFGRAPLADGRVYWFAVATGPAGTRAPDEHAEVRRLFGGWHQPVPALVEATAPAAVLRHDVYDLARPLPSFRRGGCLLLGDAAHAGPSPSLARPGSSAERRRLFHGLHLEPSQRGDATTQMLGFAGQPPSSSEPGPGLSCRRHRQQVGCPLGDIAVCGQLQRGWGVRQRRDKG